MLVVIFVTCVDMSIYVDICKGAVGSAGNAASVVIHLLFHFLASFLKTTSLCSYISEDKGPGVHGLY